jgi:hypothetical protein
MVSKRPRPTGFEWCPVEVWDAFCRGEGLHGFPPKTIQSAVNGPFRERLSRLLIDDRILPVIEKLSNAKLLKDVAREDAVEKVMHLASQPAENFLGNFDWESEQIKHEDLARTAEKLLRQMRGLDRFTLQAKTDVETDFGKTGRFLDTEKLFDVIDSFVGELIRECRLPVPPDTELIPRKRKTKDPAGMVTVKRGLYQVSVQTLANIKGRLLRREMSKLFEEPLHGVIAALINLTEPIQNPVDADWVRKTLPRPEN